MKHLILSSTVVLALAAFGYGQVKTKPGGTSGNDQQLITQMGRDWINAELKLDAAKIGEILADDFRNIDWEGKTLNKSEYLDQAKASNNENKLTAFEPADETVSIHGDTAVSAGRYSMKFINAGKSGEGTGRYVVVSAKRQGKWRPIFSQFFPTAQQ